MLIHSHSDCFKNLKSKMSLSTNRDRFLEKKRKAFQGIINLRSIEILKCT